MPNRYYKNLTAKQKAEIYEDWVTTGDRYLDIADRHNVSIAFVKKVIEEVLGEAMTNKQMFS